MLKVDRIAELVERDLDTAYGDRARTPAEQQFYLGRAQVGATMALTAAVREQTEALRELRDAAVTAEQLAPMVRDLVVGMANHAENVAAAIRRDPA